MSKHVVGTSNIFDFWRSWCSCGWYRERKTLKTALKDANRHLDQAAAPAPGELES